MLELAFFGFIFLTIAYWAVLFTVGRRADVLHGEFVTEGASPEVPAQPAKRMRPLPQPASARPEPVVTADLRRERLESLLDTIKQDLNQIVPK